MTRETTLQGMAGALWPAPTVTGRVVGTVRLPGSKSITNRALIIAALAETPSVIRRPLRSRDTLLMANALRGLGVDVDDDATGADWHVTPRPLSGPGSIDVGLAGTVMRFVPPVAALAKGEVSFDGDERARQRPIGPLLNALRTLGVEIDDGGRGALPFTVYGRGGAPGGVVTLDASPSSQFISGLLLFAARTERGVEVRHVGPPMPSAPHVAMTVAMLRHADVAVDDSEQDVWRVSAGPISGRDIVVEPDLSNALPFLAAALVAVGTVTVVDWPSASKQPVKALVELFKQMGGALVVSENKVTAISRGKLHGIEVELRDLGELVPTLAVLAALADSPSRFAGIAHLRGHETDRLAALTREINGLGGDVRETADGLEIYPRPLHGGVFHTYDDHRMATSAAVLGLAVPGVQVENVATTDKTLPNFVHLWTRMVSQRG